MKFISAQKNSAKKELSGFAMLFAVLASSLLIAVGASIFNISLKELQIATSVEASQAAYYVADSAEECALYWDIKIGSIPACLDSACSQTSTSTTNTITCNGHSVTLNFAGGAGNGNAYTYTSPVNTAFFQASSTDTVTNPSATIFMKTQYMTASSSIQTTITAYGHNSGIIGRRVERGITEVHNN